MRLLTLSIIFILAFSPTDARKANEAYHNGEYELAAELYRSAIEADPENPRLYFNLGNTLTKLGNTEEAIQAYEQYKSLTDNPEQQSLADYNIGNLYSDNEDMQKAAEYYRKSLQNNPGDPDAKHNYELAMRQQQEQQQDPQQNQDQNQDENQEQNQNDDQNGDEDQNQQDQNENQNQEDQQSPQDQSQNEQQQPRMSPEEAESILDALAQRERELLRDLRKESETDNSNNEKDW